MNQTTHLASIVYGAKDAIFSKTLDGLITSWNAGAERMYGYTPEEILGRPVEILAPRDRKDEIHTILERLRRGETIDHFITKRVAKNGDVLDVSLVISPVRDIHGQIVGASTIARDVTDVVGRQQDRDKRQVRAYVFVVIIGLLGFWQTQHYAHKAHYENCVAINQNRIVLRTLINEQVDVANGTKPPPGADPALVAAIENSVATAKKFQSFANSKLVIQDCPRPTWWP